ncbi:hypothetical protein [Paraburkholderia dokdonensis]|uniref:hypothetical protein n=1 Tax=Paraburkholderia dokdonensis TaxID=2211211 RepID=UPI00101AA7EC|nr:hypothetical protein [Paraburkholderia dokdonensis]
MSKHQHVIHAPSKRRIFPNDYTRDDLIEYVVLSEAENYSQAEQIEALTQRVHELESRLRKPASPSR